MSSAKGRRSTRGLFTQADSAAKAEEQRQYAERCRLARAKRTPDMSAIQAELNELIPKGAAP